MSPKKSLFLSLTAALAALVMSSVALGQALGAGRGDNGSGSNRQIQGRVNFPDNIIEGRAVRVTLESPDIGTRSTVTDQDGVFFFNNLQPNTYQVTVEGGADYTTYRESIQIESALVSKMVVNLQYKRGAGPLAGVSDAAIQLFQKGGKASAANDYKLAVEQLQQALALQPNFGLAQNEMGMVYLRQGDFENAITNFVQAEKNLPKLAGPFLNHGVALVEQKKFSEAKTPLQEALKRDPKLATAHLYLGIAAVGLKDLDVAEKEFVTAAKTGGESVARAHYFLGGIYWARKDMKKAADEMELYLKMRPNAPEAERLRKTIQELRK